MRLSDGTWVTHFTGYAPGERPRRAYADASFIDPENPLFSRASGESRCKLCGLEYWKHEAHPIHDYLRVLCVGRLVKL